MSRRAGHTAMALAPRFPSDACSDDLEDAYARACANRRRILANPLVVPLMAGTILRSRSELPRTPAQKMEFQPVVSPEVRHHRETRACWRRRSVLASDRSLRRTAAR